MQRLRGKFFYCILLWELWKLWKSNLDSDSEHRQPEWQSMWCAYSVWSLEADKHIWFLLRFESFYAFVFRVQIFFLIFSTVAVSWLLCSSGRCWDDGAVKWSAQVSHVSLVSYSTYSGWVTQEHSAVLSEFSMHFLLPGCGPAVWEL